MEITQRSKRLEHLAYANPDIFSERLTEAMNDAKASAAQLANEGVVNKEAITAYKKGDRLPNGRTLLYLCNYLNISADWLLGFTDEKRRIWK